MNILPNRDGLVHVFEIKEGRVEKVTDVLHEGDKVKVLCQGMDNRGKIKLSMKRVNQETGELMAPEKKKHTDGEEDAEKTSSEEVSE